MKHAIEILLVLTAFALMACSERIVYKKVNVPVYTLPEVPEGLMLAYPGINPKASADGEVCFAGEEIKNLQEWMLFHKIQNDALKELLQ